MEGFWRRSIGLLLSLSSKAIKMVSKQIGLKGRVWYKFFLCQYSYVLTRYCLVWRIIQKTAMISCAFWLTESWIFEAKRLNDSQPETKLSSLPNDVEIFQCVVVDWKIQVSGKTKWAWLKLTSLWAEPSPLLFYIIVLIAPAVDKPFRTKDVSKGGIGCSASLL